MVCLAARRDADTVPNPRREVYWAKRAHGRSLVDQHSVGQLD